MPRERFDTRITIITQSFFASKYFSYGVNDSSSGKIMSFNCPAWQMDCQSSNLCKAPLLLLMSRGKKKFTTIATFSWVGFEAKRFLCLWNFSSSSLSSSSTGWWRTLFERQPRNNAINQEANILPAGKREKRGKNSTIGGGVCGDPLHGEGGNGSPAGETEEGGNSRLLVCPKSWFRAGGHHHHDVDDDGGGG